MTILSCKWMMLSGAGGLEFIDRTRDYQPAKTVASRTSRSHLAQHRISLPLVADEQQLNTVLEDWLKSRWVGRDTIKISLPRSHINIAVGHEFVLEQDTASRRWRVNSIEEAEALVIYATAVTNLENRPPKLAVVQPVSTKFLKLGRPRVEFMDLPQMPHSDREDSNRIAVAADPWPGLMAVYASSGTGSFSLIQTVDLMASVGHLPEGLFATHATSRWNYGGPVEIKLDTGVLTSVSSIDVMNGKNSLAIQTHRGDWEILQFQEAELIGDNRWLLRNLLRGQLGTEREAADGAPAGSSVVVLNEAVQNLGSGQPFSGLDISWKVGPAASSLADPEFFAGTYMPGYRGLTPYSPVHVRVDKDASDISIHWVRRNRIDADDWNYVEVPQSEDRELYRVLLEDVSSGTSATFDTQQPSLALSVAEMRQILGSKAAELKGTVSQMSEKTGAGLPAQFSIRL